MNDLSNKIEVDHLAVGLTRPPMFMGVAIRLFFTNIAICTLLCIDAHTLLGIPLWFILHFISVTFSVKDPQFLNIWLQSFFKTPPVLNYGFWGKTNSYEPW